MADDLQPGPRRPKGVLGDLVTAESMIQFAISLPAACLIGWLAGTWLDKHLHQAWMAVTGLLLGAVAGFVQIFRMASGYLKRDGQ